MLQFRPFDAMPDIVDGIELDNPAMVARIRRAADKLSHYEISAHLANAITGAAPGPRNQQHAQKANKQTRDRQAIDRRWQAEDRQDRP